MTSTNTKASAQKSGRLYAIVGILVILLAFVAVTFFLITKESRNEQEWIRLSTDLQVHSQQVAKSAAEAVEGTRSAFYELGDSVGTISATVETLKHGDPTRSLPALPSSIYSTLSDLDTTWVRLETNSRSILEREALVLDLADASDVFIQAFPEIQELTDRAIRELTRNNAPGQQVFGGGGELVRSDRIMRHL